MIYYLKTIILGTSNRPARVGNLPGNLVAEKKSDLVSRKGQSPETGRQ